MEETFELISDFQPVWKLVFGALSSNPAYHSTYMVYMYLLNGMDTVASFTNQKLADDLGFSKITVLRATKILRKLGLVVVLPAEKIRRVVATHVPCTDDRLPKVLLGISRKQVTLDLKEGRVVNSKTGTTFDAEELKLGILRDTRILRDPRYPEGYRIPRDTPPVENGSTVTYDTATSYDVICQNGSAEGSAAKHSGNSSSNTGSRNTRSSISTRINKLLTAEFYTKEAMPLSNAYNLPLAGFDKTKDPYRTEIESIQAHANAVLGTRLKVYGPEGKINERYGIILRALHHFGFTADQLKQAIDNAKNHHYWGSSANAVKDLIKLFRKEANIGELVSYSGAPLHQKPDLRHLENRAVYGEKVVETFEF